MSGGFPFSAVVGADEAKLALLLAAIEPAIGGVLLRGQKGSAKSTLARGIADLLPRDAPFVDLPVGATEDRVVGSIDLTAALTGGEVRLRPGLLADADGGVLYVDEVNLLPDHLVDVLLDVAASGVNRVEREGVAAAHPARFVLVGSMNPEEGELRPQLLDRFGLAVDVVAPADPAVRAEAVIRRLAFDAGASQAAASYGAADAELRQRLRATLDAGPGALAPGLVEAVSALCVSVGAEGLRADLVICRAAAALARWEGRASAEEGDVRRVAPLALAHRARRNPLDPHGVDEERLAEAMDDAFAPREQHDRPAPERVAVPDPPAPVTRLVPPAGDGTDPPPGRGSTALGARGRLIGDRVPGGDGPDTVAVAATVRASVARRAGNGDGPLVAAGDLREGVHTQRTANLVILAVDASGSMGAERRMEAAKGAVLSLLIDSYQRRDRVALVTFSGDAARVVLRPTGSVEIAKARLADLPTGDRTPLAAGIRAALEVAVSGSGAGHQPLIVLVTDGRATAAADGEEPTAAAATAAAAVRREGVPAVVVDVEQGPTRLGLAAEIATAMGARLLSIEELSSAGLASAVRVLLPVR